MLLKGVLRGRSILLIEDRTDIVGAAEADGVVLSRQGCCSLQTGTEDIASKTSRAAHTDCDDYSSGVDRSQLSRYTVQVCDRGSFRMCT